LAALSRQQVEWTFNLDLPREIDYFERRISDPAWLFRPRTASGPLSVLDRRQVIPPEAFDIAPDSADVQIHLIPFSCLDR
jgi:hypothetical protein